MDDKPKRKKLIFLLALSHRDFMVSCLKKKSYSWKTCDMHVFSPMINSIFQDSTDSESYNENELTESIKNIKNEIC